MKMPVYERRFFIVTKINEINDMMEKNENSSSSVSTGKGTRTTMISGQSLKGKIKSGEIKDI